MDHPSRGVIPLRKARAEWRWQQLCEIPRPPQLSLGAKNTSVILGPMTLATSSPKVKQRLVVPTTVPWKTLKGRDLEECLYWLVDDLGGKELQWRTGTTGESSADQGRDLEALFYPLSPTSEPIRQRWWFEAKGRDKVVEARAIHNSLARILNRDDVDVMVIATNSAFSNPTRDWVTEWQEQHPRPRVYLWDLHDLERLVSQHPAVVLRLFPKSLTPQGRLNAAAARFWDYVQYVDSATLSSTWEDRLSLEWDTSSVMAFVASEFANGDIDKRPWVSVFSSSSIIRILQTGLSQVLSFCLRGENAGRETGTYTDAVGYLILKCLQVLPKQDVEKAIRASWRGKSKLYSPGSQDFILETVLHNLVRDLFVVCASDCCRVIHSGSDKPSFRDWAAYWNRFQDHNEIEPKETRASDRYDLIIEKRDEPCKVGFRVNRNQGCPLNVREKLPDLSSMLAVLSRVVRFRTETK